MRHLRLPLLMAVVLVLLSTVSFDYSCSSCNSRIDKQIVAVFLTERM